MLALGDKDINCIITLFHVFRKLVETWKYKRNANLTSTNESCNVDEIKRKLDIMEENIRNIKI